MHRYEKELFFFISSNIGDIKLCKFRGGGGSRPPPPSKSAHGSHVFTNVHVVSTPCVLKDEITWYSCVAYNLNLIIIKDELRQ